MTESVVRYTGGVAFEAWSRGHRILCDQPREAGGEDRGMTPPEFLTASLGTCAGYYAVQYLRKHNLPAEGVEVRVAAEKVRAPARLGSIRLELIVPGLDPSHNEGILRSVHACLIHNTLLHPPQVVISGTFAAAALQS